MHKTLSQHREHIKRKYHVDENIKVRKVIFLKILLR